MPENKGNFGGSKTSLFI